jgi:hypothetical protein
MMAGTSILLCGGSQISPDFTKRIKRLEESDPSTGHPFYRSTFLHWTVDNGHGCKVERLKKQYLFIWFNKINYK